jgi:CubicO group peptidase (beta-lactamase class C family)
MKASPPMLALLLISAALPLAAQNARVDSVFAQYDRQDSPGCAVGVFRNGQIAYSHGYGMANIELGVPISAEHVFYVGSVSKQFTAMSIALLVQDGKISLDDDVRKYVPEVPDLGKRITIRHLVHHLGGLREKWDLFAMEGMRDGDVVTQADVIDLVRRQKAANFNPGDEHLYSNTGYDILSTIVQRVSGKSHREFAQERIFGPLGMTKTRYIDDRELVLPGRADAYAPKRGGGYITSNVSHVETTGSGGVHSSIPDLLRWDESFYTGALGGSTLTTMVQTPGTLNNGDKLTYAFGLTIDSYGGRRRVHHGGALGGYRAMLMRFPDEHFSVALLCNIATANTTLLAERVTDAYLTKPAATATANGNAPLGEDQPMRYAGVYFNFRTEGLMRFVARDGAVAVDGGPALKHEGSHQFRMGNQETMLRFDVTHAGLAERVRVVRPGARESVFERVTESKPSAAQLNEYTGSYRSDELNTSWRVDQRDGKLKISGARGEVSVELTPLFADAFSGAGWIVRFGRESGRVTGLTVTTGRSRRVAFAREAAR